MNFVRGISSRICAPGNADNIGKYDLGTALSGIISGSIRHSTRYFPENYIDSQINNNIEDITLDYNTLYFKK